MPIEPKVFQIRMEGSIGIGHQLQLRTMLEIRQVEDLHILNKIVA